MIFRKDHDIATKIEKRIPQLTLGIIPASEGSVDGMFFNGLLHEEPQEKRGVLRTFSSTGEPSRNTIHGSLPESSCTSCSTACVEQNSMPPPTRLGCSPRIHQTSLRRHSKCFAVSQRESLSDTTLNPRSSDRSEPVESSPDFQRCSTRAQLWMPPVFRGDTCWIAAAVLLQMRGRSEWNLWSMLHVSIQP